MKTVAVFLLATAMAQGQYAPNQDAPNQDAPSDIVAAAAAARARKANSTAAGSVIEMTSHGSSSNVHELIEALGLRATVTAALEQVRAVALATLREKCTRCDPRFVEEFSRRLPERLSADMFLGVYEKAFAKHFSNEEIAQLLDQRKRELSGGRVQDSPQLKQRLESVLLPCRKRLLPSSKSWVRS